MTGEIVEYYQETNLEGSRLSSDLGPLERDRTLDIFKRYLPAPPAVVADVGGGTGVYSVHLLKQGYQAHLVDLVPGHVNLARNAMASVSRSRNWSAEAGDALSLNFPTGFFDVVLLMGPLYHLQKKADRLKALDEAFRSLKVGGWLFCTIISKFASLIDGLKRGFITDPAFRKIIAGDLKNGCHDNPTGKVEYFTRAYFQHPDELSAELLSAGFTNIRVLAVEGILWAASDCDELLKHGGDWESAFEFMRGIEEDRSIMGLSPHIMGIGRKLK